MKEVNAEDLKVGDVYCYRPVTAMSFNHRNKYSRIFQMSFRSNTVRIWGYALDSSGNQTSRIVEKEYGLKVTLEIK